MNHRDNHCRWDGGPGHYEVWYLTGNHRPSQTGYWIRYTLESPVAGHGEPYAQLWFAHFDGRAPERNFAINRKLPVDELTTSSDPFSVRLGQALLAGDRARGQLSGAGREASWDVRWQPSGATHRHLPSIMYLRGGLGETTVLSPNLDVAARGTISVGDRVYELDGEPLGQTHLWGKKHAHAWAWGHCNAFADRPGAALEILSVVLKRRGLVLPRMTVFSLYLDGRVHRFNQFRHTLLTGARTTGTRFSFHGQNARWRVEGEFTCQAEDMVVAPYADPDGEPSYCSNTEVADLTVTVSERRLGWRPYAHLEAPRSGHFEIGARTRDPSVTRDHILIP